MGGVINEAMNSGYAVVARHAIGAVPLLIQHEYNGMIYTNGKTEQAYEIIKDLSFNRDKIKQIGLAAYSIIEEMYNPNV